MRRWAALGSFICGLGVILGALGAHALKTLLTERELASYHTATQYLFLHGLALILVDILQAQAEEGRRRAITRSGFFFAAGIVLFSGSIYLLIGGAPRFFGPLTPLGGLSFMSGWLNLAAVFFRRA